MKTDSRDEWAVILRRWTKSQLLDRVFTLMAENSRLEQQITEMKRRAKKLKATQP